MARYTFDYINERTGFAGGVKFDTPEEVRAYFTQKNMDFMFGSDPVSCDPLPLGCTDSDIKLRMMAETVIENGWWCNFSGRK